jgi:hypothetical protein
MTDPRPVPTYLIERLLAGELEPSEADELRRRLAAEPDGAARLAALEADGRATLISLPPARVAEEVRRRSGRSRRGGRLVAPALTLGALAAALLLVVLPGPDRDQAPDEVRLKGPPSRLVIHRQVAGGVEVLRSGATARAGDLLQLGYVVARPGYGVIVSLDGLGQVTRHLPAEGAGAAPLETGHEVLLPASYRLDAAPAFERFLLVTSPAPFRVDEVLAAAGALAGRADAGSAPVMLGRGFAVASTVVAKENR